MVIFLKMQKLYNLRLISRFFSGRNIKGSISPTLCHIFSISLGPYGESLLNTFVCSFKALRCRSQCRFKRVDVVLVTMNRDMGISKRSNYASAAARNVSQSATDRRNGSNAGTFIALFFDYIYCYSSLPTPPVGQPFTRQ